MRRLKIVHIVQMLLTGGAEKLLFDLALRCNLEHDVTVICQFQPQNTFYEKALVDAGVKVIFLNKKKGFHLPSFFELYKVLSEIKPNVIHTHLHSSIYAIPWYVFNRKNARIHTIHSIAPMEFGKIHRILQGFAYRFLNVVPVAISNVVKKSVVDQYKLNPKKVALILNGIDTEKYTKTQKNNSEIFTVINVASFSKWKNQALLVEAFNICLQKNSNMRLVFVGDGEQRQNVHKMVVDFNIEDKVDFVGISTEVEKWLSLSDVFVLCSTFEGLPLSILEAFAVGLPVVATDVGGISDVLTEGENGFLVPSNEKIPLSQAILCLADNPNIYDKISKANVIKAKEFDIEKTKSSYIKLYMEKLNEMVIWGAKGQ